jgi:hypothetical protein
MSQLKQAVHNNIQALQLLRDELKLQAHLLSGELEQSWQKAEADFDRLKLRAKRAAEAGAAAEAEIETELRKTVDTVRSSLEKLRASLKR